RARPGGPTAGAPEGSWRHFPVDLAHQVEEAGEGVEAGAGVPPGRGGPQRGDTCIPVEAEPVPHHGRGAQEVGLESYLDGHPVGGRLPFAVEPQALDLVDLLGEPLTGEGVVVEVLVP